MSRNAPISHRVRRLAVAALVGILPVLGSTAGSSGTTHEPITVYAAISLSQALEAAASEFTRESGIPVRHVFASSAQLARQIEAGARADVFISADQRWMNHLASRKLVDRGSIRSIAGNRLSVIVPNEAVTRAATTRLDPRRVADWNHIVGRGRWVTGDPDSVPLGRYAREALESLGAWQSIAPRLARAENARAALTLVARGEAALGIVYATDAIGERRVRIVADLPTDLHTPIEYPAAPSRSATPAATLYLQFLQGPQGERVLRRHGFSRPQPTSLKIVVP